jgi:hypothetical protein
MSEEDLNSIAAVLDNDKMRIAALNGNMQELLRASEGIRLRQDWEGMIAALAASNLVLTQILLGMLKEEQ